MSEVRGTEQPRRPASPDVRVEHEQIGVHNEAQTIRRDRIRWGPVWAGVVTAIGTFIFLQLALVAVGIVDLNEEIGGDAVASGIAALVAFFLGGVTAGATSMWQGADDGILHGIVMWFAALVAVIVLAALGSGIVLGAFDTEDAFNQITDEQLDTDQANDDAQEAAGVALAALTLGLAAAAAGGAVGAKIWPKDDVVIDVARVRSDTR
jgi:hypothetical protein